jgi:hypothetical protein
MSRSRTYEQSPFFGSAGLQGDSSNADEETEVKLAEKGRTGNYYDDKMTVPMRPLQLPSFS